MSAQPQQRSQAASDLAEAVRQQDHPVAASKLKVKGSNQKAVAQLLEELAGEKLIHRWWKGKSVAYWHRPSEEYAAEVALAVAAERALERPKLAQAVARQCFGRYSQEKCRVVVRQLLQSGALTELQAPGVSRTKVVFAAAHPGAYLASMAGYLRPLLEGAERLGASRQQFIALLLESQQGRPAEDTAVNEPTAEAFDPSVIDRLYRALEQTQFSPGAHVAVNVLRRQPLVADLSKTDFDSAVLKLADQERVDLAAHDDVHNLSPERREELVFEAPDKYYVAIATRN